MDTTALTVALKRHAASLGFTLTGACPAVTPRGMASVARWLASGFAGEMTYVAGRFAAYEHPRHILPGARSLLMLGLPYDCAEWLEERLECRAGECDAAQPASGVSSSAPRPSTRLEGPPRQAESHAAERRATVGRVARYAWSPVDYHEPIHQRLRLIGQLAAQLRPGVRVRGVVDTAPLLEREFAQLAGLGWIGKNTMLLNRQQGSWFFLAALLLDCELDYDDPHASSHCGSCTACLSACPTQAFPEPFVLDARRCISYLTIELRGVIPHELRGAMGHWVFGCDICQEVCPWNHAAASRQAARAARRCAAGDNAATLPCDNAAGEARHVADLHALFHLSDEAFRDRFRDTALWRARRRGLLRNAAIALGNQGSAASHDVLAQALSDREPLVRGAAAWALGRLGTAAAVQSLHARLRHEPDPGVRDEIQRALA